jgi:outer membrane lipoprotein-sorting protein
MQQKNQVSVMKIFQTFLAISILTSLMISIPALSQPDAKAIDKGSGLYFEVEISSAGKSPVKWLNWRDGDKYHGESQIDGNKTVIVILDGFSYSLSPDVKVARKSKLQLDTAKNPMASQYAPLADIAQLNPETYSALLKKFNSRLQGPAKIGDISTDLYSLKIPESEKFPWNNFSIWIDKKTQYPVQVTYFDGSEQRTLKIQNVKTGIKVESDKFKIPEDYKIITFEWD